MQEADCRNSKRNVPDFQVRFVAIEIQPCCTSVENDRPDDGDSSVKFAEGVPID